MTTAARQHPVLGPVVAGTDGSDEAMRAVLWAAAEADARQQPLTVLHGASTTHAHHTGATGALTALEEGRAALDLAAATAADHHPTLTIDTVLSRAEPGESLLEAAGPHHTLVVGSRGHGGFTSLLLGSTSLHLCARSPRPVIVVRDIPRPPTAVIAVAVRDDGDRDALRFAAHTAQAHHATLRVISAWKFLEAAGSMAAVIDDVAEIARLETEATRRTVDPVREEFPDLAIIEDVLRTQSVAGSLVDLSPTTDLLVMGARRPAHSLGTPLGRTTHAVLHHAHCPIAVVPRR